MMTTVALGIIVACIALVGAQNKITQVAFSASLSHDLILTGGEDIVYDNVFTNIGNAYDNITGKFKCPQAGTYEFQFHGLSKSNQILYLELYHNYKYVASAYSHTDNDWAAGGNNVIIHLSKGDTVNIKNMATQDSQLYGTAMEQYCTFSGYLLTPYFEETPVVG